MGDRRPSFPAAEGFHNALFRHGRAVPAIHVAPFPATPRVSGRSTTWMTGDKPGHDDFGVVVFTQRASA
jgi:hypothetical protein